MIANKFIKDEGIERAKAILNSAPKQANYFETYPLRPRFYLTDIGCNRAVSVHELKHLVESIDLIESLGGLCAALDAQYLEETQYLNNAVRIDAAIKDLRDWFKVGDVVVRKKGDDIALRKITGLFRDGCLAECDDGFSHHIVDIRHATIKEKSEGKRTEGDKA